MRIWITRTQPQADETADRVRGLGHEPLVVPVLECRPVSATASLDEVGAIAFTSRNAVAAFARLTPRRDIPVFATGDATAQDARAAGFADVRSAAGDVAALAALIASARPAGVVLHPGAREAAGDLCGDLARAGVAARNAVIYETVETAAAAPDADAVLIHSPRAGRRVAAIAPRSLRVLAISAAAAQPFLESKFQHVAVAPSPNEPALLKLLDNGP